LISISGLDRIPGDLRQSWAKAISKVVDSGTYVGGPCVAEFEKLWASYTGASGAVGVGNGHDAIAIALRALGIGPKSVVGVPAHTFIATWQAVHSVGAVPVGIDCDPFGQMDIDQFEGIAPQLHAVIPVHMHGGVVDMSRVMGIANTHDVTVIEDCAQAHGAIVEGRHVGTWGAAGAFSFYPTKNLGALGDAGIIISSDEEVLQRCRSIANYGSTTEDARKHDSFGINSRLDPIQASVLTVNLLELDAWNEKRRGLAEKYIGALAESSNSLVPLMHANKTNVWHHFVVKSPRRDEWRINLERLGIQTQVHYPTPAAYEFNSMSGTNQETPTQFPTAKQLSETNLSLPMHQWLSAEDLDFIIDSIQENELPGLPQTQIRGQK